MRRGERLVYRTGPPPVRALEARQGFLGRLLRLRMASVLTSRYVDLKIGDFWGTLILILQAPLIGLLICVAFDGARESLRLQFVLAITAVWFGTFNSCREVVKERLIFLRERRMGVPVRAYIVSKLLVLAGLGAVQCVLLLVLVARAVRFESPLPLVFLVLWLTTLCSTCLGLLLSSLVESQNSLIALVPVALIPQLIFSDMLLPDPPAVVERIELFMVAQRSLDMLRELPRSDPGWLSVAADAGALVAMSLVLLLIAGVCLRAQEE